MVKIARRTPACNTADDTMHMRVYHAADNAAERAHIYRNLASRWKPQPKRPTKARHRRLSTSR
jgi:hypothetical protein